MERATAAWHKVAPWLHLPVVQTAIAVVLIGVLRWALNHRIGKLPRFHAPLDGVENPPMHGIGEVVRRQIFADTLKRLVIGQKRAKQRLFGRQV